MRIPSGKTDQYIYFVAFATADGARLTGLSGFTVYRSRNGVAEVAYTTPTISEIDATNMPGVYALLIDEDTTIASTSDSEEYCVQIAVATMEPVTRTIELYRPELDITDGIESGLTLRQAMRVVAAACAGKASGLATATAVYRNAEADSKDRITATVDADGNRTAVTLDLT